MFHYRVKLDSSGRAVLYERTDSTEMRVGPLPERYSDAARELMEMYEAKFPSPAVRWGIGFTLGGRPLAVLYAQPQVDGDVAASYAPNMVDTILPSGRTRNDVDLRAFAAHTAQTLWARRVIGVGQLDSDYLLFWIETGASEYDDFAAELDRRGVEPPMVEVTEAGEEGKSDPKPQWCVWRDGINGTVTFGPFEDKQAAEDFTDSPYGGHVYDANENARSVCGPWLP